MKVGCLGNIIFSVDDQTVQTLNNLNWKGSARYSNHQRHATNAITEFTGLDPDKIDFEVYLDRNLGVDVRSALNMMWKYEREAEVLPLVIGNHAFGKYRWSILSHSVKAHHLDGKGNIINCTVSLSLQEYLKN